MSYKTILYGISVSLLFATTTIFPLNISGTVRDDKSKSVSGALITLKSNNKSTTTGSDGTFSMIIDAIHTIGHLPSDGSMKIDGRSLTINSSKNKHIDILLYNIQGKVINRSSFISIRKGINSIDITNGSKVPSGIYVVLVKDENINLVVTTHIGRSASHSTSLNNSQKRASEIIDTLVVKASGFDTKKVPVLIDQNKYSITLSSIDLTAPVIKISGANPDTVLLNGTFSKPTVTATDNVDGDISGKIISTGSVNSDKIGKYEITYSVTDYAGNSATKILTVYVMAIHKNIIATKFWVGEGESPDNGNIDNIVSAWDEKWAVHYGGIDDPNNRNGYYPSAFTPKENPFYFALPYNDFNDVGHKSNITQIPWYSEKKWTDGESLCKNRWIKVINKSGKAAYAQWEDVGPFLEDDVNYVFGMSQPSNTELLKAGLDLSPATEDYLNLQGQDNVTWFFVDESDVPDGPWKDIVTTSDPFWQ